MDTRDKKVTLGEDTEPRKQDLNGWWHLWFDEAADWRAERLPLPGTPVAEVSPTVPTAGWQAMAEAAEGLEVPGTWEEARPRYHGVAWQWRPIIVPEEWAGRIVRLRLEAVRLYCQVYLERVLVGYDYDGLSPFEVDLTSHVRPGKQQELALRIVNPGGTRPGQAEEPISWGGLVLPPSHDAGGIWGNVSLVSSGPMFAKAVRVRVSEGSTLAFEVSIANRGAGNRVSLRVIVRDERGERIAASEVVEGHVDPGTTSVVPVRVSADGLEGWCPESPRLYEAEVILGGDHPADALRVPFGIRRLTSREGRYMLNGRPFELRAARSGGWYPLKGMLPDARLAQREVRAARELGLNALYLDGHVGSSALLDAADREGLLIIQRPPVLGGDPRLVRERLARLGLRDGYRPSTLLIEGPLSEPAAALIGETTGLRLPQDADQPCEAPDVPMLSRCPVPLADLEAVTRAYRGRILPGSDGQVWAQWAAEVQEQCQEHGLSFLFSNAGALARSAARVAYREMAQQIRLARMGGMGIVLPEWADDTSGSVGVVNAFREPKSEVAMLSRAMDSLSLAILGLARQARRSTPVVVQVGLINQRGLRGSFTIEIRHTRPDGSLAAEETAWAELSGQPLQILDTTQFLPEDEGENVVRATLYRGERSLVTADRSVWVAHVPPLDGPHDAKLGILGDVGPAGELLEGLGITWQHYRLGDKVDALLISSAAPVSGLANAIFSGALRRIAIVCPEVPKAGEGWTTHIPELASVATLERGQPALLIGSWYRDLLQGVGSPAIWWHAEEAMLPGYLLRGALPQPVVTAVGMAHRGDGSAVEPCIGTVLGLGRLGEAELLFCALPLLEASRAKVPTAERLLRNIVAWLVEGRA